MGTISHILRRAGSGSGHQMECWMWKSWIHLEVLGVLSLLHLHPPDLQHELHDHLFVLHLATPALVILVVDRKGNCQCFADAHFTCDPELVPNLRLIPWGAQHTPCLLPPLPAGKPLYFSGHHYRHTEFQSQESLGTCFWDTVPLLSSIIIIIVFSCLFILLWKSLPLHSLLPPWDRILLCSPGCLELTR